MSSKKDGEIDSITGIIDSVNETTRFSGIICPLILILSRKSVRWGEVYKPVLYPDDWNIEASMWLTDPLPFVPAMWIHLNFFSGFSSTLQIAKVLERSILSAAGPVLLNMGSLAYKYSRH